MADRRMIFPYTLTAKLAQFPFKYYMDNSQYFKGVIIAAVLCAPFFWKMQQLVCSDANYLNLEKYRQKEREEIEQHKHHML